MPNLDDKAWNLLMSKIEDMADDIERLESKIDFLAAWRWQIIGGSVILSGLLSIGVTILVKIL